LRRDPQPSAGVVDSQGRSRELRSRRRRAWLRRRKEGKRQIKRHILVDTEGFVLKAKVMSAKVMDYAKASRRCCIEHGSDSLASVICGWRRATEERTRARTG
jgi:hypothetical protein